MADEYDGPAFCSCCGQSLPSPQARSETVEGYCETCALPLAECKHGPAPASDAGMQDDAAVSISRVADLNCERSGAPTSGVDKSLKAVAPSPSVGELVDRLERLALRREQEGIYTDRNICEQSATALKQQAGEIEAQARLNGMGAERELRLRAQLSEAQATIERAREQVELAIAWPERQDEPFTDILERIRAALSDRSE